MSGPKVVRIVTREELQAICEALLRGLDRAIAAWTSDGHRFGTLEKEEIASVQRRRESLAGLMAEGRFTEMQTRIAEEIAYLSGDLDRRRERAVDAAMRARQQARQQRENAAALLHELRRKGISDQEAVLTELGLIANGETASATAESVLSKGFLLLAAGNSTAGATDAQRELARRLAPAEDLERSRQWKATRAKLTDGRLLVLDRRLAELDADFSTELTNAFATRVRALEMDSASPSNSMRIDTLVLDIGKALRKQRADKAAILEAREVADELQSTSLTRQSDMAELHRKLTAAIASTKVEALASLVEAGRAALLGQQRKFAAKARRDAILDGLASLGYEVREGMSTAWAEKGRVIIAKASLPGYGVELGGSSDLERLQVRAVAFKAQRDHTRDKDVETIWCSDFGKLQKYLGTRGGTLGIEKALAVGMAPLKTVSAAEDGRQTVTGSRAAGAS